MWQVSCRLITIVLLSFSGGVALSQNINGATEKVNVEPQTGFWAGLYMKFRLSNRIFYYHETHYRRRNSIEANDFIGRMNNIYNRFGVTYFFSEYFDVTVGPVIKLDFSPEPGNPEFDDLVVDARIWHQWLFNHKVGNSKVLHQFRFEHRWKRDLVVDAPYEFTNRYRYKIFAYIPLNRPVMADRTLFLSPSNEIFIQTGRNIVYNPFEDNRVYTSIGYTSGNFIYTLGHMWTYAQLASGFEYRHRHIIRASIYYNVDLRRNILRPRLTD